MLHEPFQFMGKITLRERQSCEADKHEERLDEGEKHAGISYKNTCATQMKVSPNCKRGDGMVVQMAALVPFFLLSPWEKRTSCGIYRKE